VKALLAEKDRIVIVTDPTDVHWVFQASAAGAIKDNTIELPVGTKFMIIENQVVVLGGVRRPPSTKDLSEAARENWRDPFETTQMFWEYSGRKSAELIQFLRSTLNKPTAITVKAAVTWWCVSEGEDCHPSKE
jgi:hypothetical protein